MKNSNKPSTKQLEKYSAVFMQIGLVLTLFIVYLLLEHKTSKSTLATFKSNFKNPSQIFIEDTPIIFEKKVSKLKKIIQKKSTPIVFINEIIKGKNTIAQETLERSIIDDEKNIETALKNYKEEILEEPEDDTHLFVFLEKTPVFKGCEGLSNKENKKCFDKKIKKFVQRNFNTSIAQDIGLSSGKYTIYTEFIIDKTGNIIDVKVRAPHKRLKNETEKMIKKLPHFIPGKQRNKPVKVKYTLPISFRVE